MHLLYQLPNFEMGAASNVFSEVTTIIPGVKGVQRSFLLRPIRPADALYNVKPQKQGATERTSR